MGVIFFLLWCSFLVPSLKNTALIFLEIFVIECCSVLVEPPMTSSLFSFAQYKNVNISITKKKIFQTEKRPSSFIWKTFQISSIFFNFIGTLITMISPAVGVFYFKKSPHQLASWLPVNVLNNVLFICIAIFFYNLFQLTRKNPIGKRAWLDSAALFVSCLRLSPPRQTMCVTVSVA